MISSYFPYESASSTQLRIMETIEDLKVQQSLMIEADTGSGKTIASLTALLERRQEDEKIIIFVKTINQMNAFLREWSKIVTTQLPVEKWNSLPLILPLLGQQRTCSLPFNFTGYTVINCYEGVFASLNSYEKEKLLYILKRQNHRHRLLKWLNMHLVENPTISTFVDLLVSRENCPYYNALSCLTDADIVLTTYPYLRNVLFQQLLTRMEVNHEQVMILVDEAHNLVIDNFTELGKQELEVLTIFIDHEFLRFLLHQMRYVHELHINQYYSTAQLRGYIRSIRRELTELKSRLDTIETFTTEQKQSLSIFADDLSDFMLNLLSGRIIASETSLSVERIEPDRLFDAIYSTKNIIFQSATLRPVRIFAFLLGLTEDDMILRLGETKIKNIRDNPQEFRAYLTQFTSHSNYRNQHIYDRYAKFILDLQEVVPDHILILTPSYEFSDHLVTSIRALAGDNTIDVLVEQPQSSQKQLHHKILSSNQQLLILGNQNGKILEGNEWVKENQSLVSTVVLAGLSTVVPREGLKFVQHERRKIFDDHRLLDIMAHEVPIYIKARQALGRTIRNDQDKGALILLDGRMNQSGDFLMMNLQPQRFTSNKELFSSLRQFFSS